MLRLALQLHCETAWLGDAACAAARRPDVAAVRPSTRAERAVCSALRSCAPVQLCSELENRHLENVDGMVHHMAGLKLKQTG